MKTKVNFKLLIMFVSICLVGCAPSSLDINTPEKMPTSEVITPVGMPDIGVPPEKLNREMGVIAPQGWNTYKTQSTIALAVNAISEHIISFDEKNTRTFLYDNGNWVELENIADVTYLGSSTMILDPAQKDSPTGSAFPSVLVDLPDPSKPALLRIFVIGYIYENGAQTDEMAASYLDMNLAP